MDRTSAFKSDDRNMVVRLLKRLPREDAIGQFHTASELAWVGIKARGRDEAVRGRLNAAARGRVGARHFRPALSVFDSMTMQARREMALALGDLAGEIAVVELIRLAGVADAEARLIAVDALGKIGGPQAVKALKAAARDKDEAVRAEAIRSLGQLTVAEMTRDASASQDGAVETLLLETCSGDPSSYVRQTAQESLAMVRERRVLGDRNRRERTPSQVSVS
ncbi:MAG: HEAT repeat domain-containing protein [Chloroflexota bacterium]